MLTVLHPMFKYIYILYICSRVSTRVLSYQLFCKMQRPFLWRGLPKFLSMSRNLLSFCYWVFSECSYLQRLSTTRYSLSDEVSFLFNNISDTIQKRVTGEWIHTYRQKGWQYLIQNTFKKWKISSLEVRHYFIQLLYCCIFLIVKVWGKKEIDNTN